MSVCILTTSYPRSIQDDVSIFIKRLSLPIAKRLPQSLLIVPKDSDEPGNEFDGPLEILRFRYGLFSKGRLAFGAGLFPNLQRKPWLTFQAPLLVLIMAFVALSRRKRFMVIHAHWIVAGCAAFIVSLLIRKPYVITIHGAEMRLLENRLFSIPLTPVLKRAKFVTVVSQTFFNTLKKLYGLKEEQLIFAPLGVDMPRISEEEKNKVKNKYSLVIARKYIIFVGTLIPRKRVDFIIELLGKPEMCDFHLLLCGKLDHAEYITQLRQLACIKKCEDRVKFLGLVPPQDIPTLLSLAQVYVTASEFEGRSVAVLEALASGLPVFASDIPAHREIIENGLNGFVFKYDQLDDVVAKIRELETDNHFRLRIANQAKATVTAFSWENSVNKYFDLLQQASSTAQ